LFLSLVLFSEDGPLARAQVPLVDLVGGADAGEQVDGRAADSGHSAVVLARFVEERLVTVDEEAAQLTHEALLTAWPRLRDWISAGRDGLKVRHRIASAATSWQEAERDDAVLLRGAPLATAVEWAADQANRASLRPLVREFLDESLSHEQAQQLAERRRANRLRQLSAILATLALLAATLTAYAFAQRHAVVLARDQADSREVAVEAEQVRSEDPSLAAQLSLAAYRISHTRTALASLLEAGAFPIASRFRDTTSLVQSIALAPDHRTLAVAGADGTLRLWSVTKSRHPFALGKSLLHLTGSPLYATAFSPNGRLLAAAGSGTVIWLFNVTDPRHVTELRPPLHGPQSTVYSLAFSPDGKILAVGSADKTVRLWDFADAVRPRSIGRPLTGPADAIQAVAISPDGQLLAAGSRDQTVRLWNIAHPARPKQLGRPLTGPTNTVNAVTFSPDGQTLAAGSRDDSVWTWNVTNPDRPVRALAPLTNATDWINALAFSPDGRMLAAASSDDTVRLWNSSTGTLLATLPGPQPITTLAWNKNDTIIAGEADGIVRAWTIPTPILLNSSSINQVAYNPEGRLLAVASASLQLWNVSTRTLVTTAAVPNVPAASLAWAPNGKLLAAAYHDGQIRLWRIDGGRLARVGPALTASTPPIAEYVAFRADSKMLVSSGDDGTVRIWDIANPARPRLLTVLRIPRTIVFSAAFSPDGRILAAASTDNLIRLWNVTDPAKPRLTARPLAGPATYAISVAFSPDSRILAVGSADKTTRLWDVTDPEHPKELGVPLAGPNGYIYSVAFSPEGATLAVGSTDGTIWLWNVADPANPSLITHLTSALSPTGHIYAVAFSPAGDRLASGSSDGSVRLWDLRPGRVAAMLCSSAGQPITRSEWASYIPGRPYAPPCP
jgi:WD40 repeat protein